MSTKRFPHLLTPLTIAGKTLRNRILHAPMSACYGTPDGYVTQAMIEHYGRRAMGGAALGIIENLPVNLAGQQITRQPIISEERYLPGLIKLAEEIKRYGALAVVQIMHAGRYAGPWEEYTQRRRLSPSALPFPLVGNIIATPQEITRAEIDETIAAFGKAAANARRAGFDGVEIHGAHGLLISQFLSPHVNRRTDEYGGSFENRIRFTLEVVRQVRENLGPDRLLGFHLMSEELLPGGWQLEEGVRLAQRLEQEGVHFLTPVAATFESLKLPENREFTNRTLHNLRAVIAVKQAVKIAVVANGRLGDPYVAEHILAHKEADLIGLARPLFTDPDWVQKIAQDKPEAIHICPCNPAVCIRTQLNGAICSHWPEEVKERGYLGYDYRPWELEVTGSR